jgi:hypothetical protein
MLLYTASHPARQPYPARKPRPQFVRRFTCPLYASSSRVRHRERSCPRQVHVEAVDAAHSSDGSSSNSGRSSEKLTSRRHRVTLTMVRFCDCQADGTCLSQQAETRRCDARRTAERSSLTRSMSKYNKHSLLMNRIADVIELLTQSKASHAIEPSVTKQFSDNALQSNEYHTISVARDGCVLKATNFNGFLRVNKWCADAPAVKSNRCGPELVYGGSILMIKRQGREL